MTEKFGLSHVHLDAESSVTACLENVEKGCQPIDVGASTQACNDPWAEIQFEHAGSPDEEVKWEAIRIMRSCGVRDARLRAGN